MWQRTKTNYWSKEQILKMYQGKQLENIYICPSLYMIWPWSWPWPLIYALQGWLVTNTLGSHLYATEKFWNMVCTWIPPLFDFSPAILKFNAELTLDATLTIRFFCASQRNRWFQTFGSEADKLHTFKFGTKCSFS